MIYGTCQLKVVGQEVPFCWVHDSIILATTVTERNMQLKDPSASAQHQVNFDYQDVSAAKKVVGYI